MIMQLIIHILKLLFFGKQYTHNKFVMSNNNMMHTDRKFEY